MTDDTMNPTAAPTDAPDTDMPEEVTPVELMPATPVEPAMPEENPDMTAE